jgi:hypothetical protein
MLVALVMIVGFCISAAITGPILDTPLKVLFPSDMITTQGIIWGLLCAPVIATLTRNDD